VKEVSKRVLVVCTCTMHVSSGSLGTLDDETETGSDHLGRPHRHIPKDLSRLNPSFSITGTHSKL